MAPAKTRIAPGVPTAPKPLVNNADPSMTGGVYGAPKPAASLIRTAPFQLGTGMPNMGRMNNRLAAQEGGDASIAPTDSFSGALANRANYLSAHGLTAHDANDPSITHPSNMPTGIVNGNQVYDTKPTLYATGNGVTYFNPTNTPTQVGASSTQDNFVLGAGSAPATGGYAGAGGAPRAPGAYPTAAGAPSGGLAGYGSFAGGAPAGPAGYGGYGAAGGNGTIPNILQNAQNAANAENEQRYEQGLNLLQTGGQAELNALSSGYQNINNMIGGLSNVDLTRAQRETTSDVAAATSRFYGMGLANTTGATMALEGIRDRGSQREQAAGDENTRLAIQMQQAYLGQQQSAMQSTRGEQAGWIASKSTLGPSSGEWAALLGRPGANGDPGAAGGYGAAAGDAVGTPGVNSAGTGYGAAAPGAFNWNFGGQPGGTVPVDGGNVPADPGAGFGTGGPGGGGFGGGTDVPVATDDGPPAQGQPRERFNPTLGKFEFWHDDVQAWIPEY